MQSGLIDEQWFDGACRDIAECFERDRSIPSLEREVYKLIGQVLDEDRADVYGDRPAKLDSRGPEGTYFNPFRLGLRLIFVGASDALPRQQRKRTAERLHYAYSHYVPAEFLTGFLYQFGSYANGITPNKFVVLPELRNWVTKQMAATDSDTDNRLPVPADIVCAANRLRDKVEGASEREASVHDRDKATDIDDDDWN